MDKFMAFISYTVVKFILVALLLALMTHIVFDIATLFEVSYILALNYCEIFGLILIVRLVTKDVPGKEVLKKMINDEGKDNAVQNFGYSLLAGTGWAIMLLGGWLTAYVVFWIFI